MQQHKSKFKDENFKGTSSNIQSCIRLNDIGDIGDGTHLLFFNMMGFFSFRELTVEETVDFWMEFLSRIEIVPDFVTVHPDKPEWEKMYQKHNVEVRNDVECKWSDGEIGGYCTEFYVQDIEIGNIVNTMGSCIDVGFGLERLELVVNGRTYSKEEILVNSILKIVNSGYVPGHYGQGYVLKKLFRQCFREGIVVDHRLYEEEKSRQNRLLYKWNRMKDIERYKSKPKEWWWNTHGIDLDFVN
jgi:alanyl-tRNA synthetase